MAILARFAPHHGYFRDSDERDEADLRAIEKAWPRALLVAMGFPRQEEWIAANLARLWINVAIAEGGSFSFISGVMPRAHPWLRRLGLEWLYRLARQPLAATPPGRDPTVRLAGGERASDPLTS